MLKKKHSLRELLKTKNNLQQNDKIQTYKSTNIIRSL